MLTAQTAAISNAIGVANSVCIMTNSIGIQKADLLVSPNSELVKGKKKGSPVSSPLDRSKRFTLFASPGSRVGVDYNRNRNRLQLKRLQS